MAILRPLPRRPSGERFCPWRSWRDRLTWNRLGREGVGRGGGDLRG